jgi:hypothetical protein
MPKPVASHAPPAGGPGRLYALRQIRGLEDLQTTTVDRNRKDSLQLVRIQKRPERTGHRQNNPEFPVRYGPGGVYILVIRQAR